MQRDSGTLTLWPSASALVGDLRRRAAAGGAGLALSDTVLADFIHRLAREDPLGPSTLDPHACRLLLHDLVQERSAEWFALPLADPRLGDLAAAALAAAQEADVDPADLLRAALAAPADRRPRLVALARLAGAYQARKRQQGLLDAGDALGAAVRALDQGRGMVPRRVQVRGLLDLTAARLLFLRALARRADVEVQLPDVSDEHSPVLAAYLEPVLEALYRQPVDGLSLAVVPLAPPGSALGPFLDALFTGRRAPGAPVTAAAFPDVVTECEAVADHCVRWLMAGASPADVAVLVRRPGERDEVLSEALAARGLTLWRRHVDARRTALVRGVVLLLRAAEGRVQVHELEALAALAGARPAQARAYAAALSTELRAVGAAGRTAPVLARAAEQFAGVESLAAALRALPDAADMETHVRQLLEALRHLPGLAARDGPPEELWARGTLRRGLDNLRVAAHRAGSRVLGRAVFTAHLEAALASPTVPPSAHAIELCSVPDVVGRRFHAVALVGLADGVFPEAAAPNPLLGEEDRLALNANLGRGAFRTEGGEGRLRAPPRDRLEPLLFALAAACASQRLLVTTAETGLDGAVHTPGPFFQEVLRALDRQAPERLLPPATRILRRRAAGVAARLGHASAEPALLAVKQALEERAQGRGPHAGVLSTRVAEQVAQRFGGTVTHPTSATALQLLGACPFRFLVEQVLRLPEVVQGSDVPMPNRMGTLAHRVLEEFLAPRLGRPLAHPSAEERAELRARVLDGGEAVGGNAAIRRAALETLAERLACSLAAWAQRPPLEGAVPVAVEMPFDALNVAPGLFVKGTLDRVDELPDGTRVAIDYKLGSAQATAQALRASQLGTGHLQLPIYLQALEASGAVRTVGYLWSLRDGRTSSFIGHGGKFTLQDVLHGHPALKHAGMLAHVQPRVEALREGRFPVLPEDGACETCPHGALCRHA